ncbi:tetratricopeptide repeat protein [Marinobacterium mangrovicola]|uniref:Sel1 repeat-containing protein n=1 Tax=Marinobacterium mangrovicola TaxID=1476959 RepID=A0A4R1G8S6_9GAMM|nr:tetratricopeptide repeat protein [Marinobacterium mangrovicola]TCK03003.1 Sel1 repeat-containing protein [Marinobacterium mangrovicola]
MRRLALFFTAGAFITLGGCTQIGLIGSSTPTRDIAEKASQGDADAQYQMGLRFTNGADVLQDYTMGLRYFTDAAEQGHSNAQYMLGMAYYLGRGTHVDYEEARHWLKPAAQQHHREAMHYLGEIYFNGYGTDRAPAWGVQWSGQAAERGYPEAQYLLGVSYLSGLGSPRNKNLGMMWLSSASKLGSLRATELINNLDQKRQRQAPPQSTLRNLPLNKKYRIRYAQIRLNELGHPAGYPDGIWGPSTERAANSFMRKTAFSLDSLIEALRKVKEPISP